MKCCTSSASPVRVNHTRGGCMGSMDWMESMDLMDARAPLCQAGPELHGFGSLAKVYFLDPERYTAELSVDLSGMNGISLPSEVQFNHVCRFRRWGSMGRSGKLSQVKLA